MGASSVYTNQTPNMRHSRCTRHAVAPSPGHALGKVVVRTRGAGEGLRWIRDDCDLRRQHASSVDRLDQRCRTDGEAGRSPQSQVADGKSGRAGDDTQAALSSRATLRGAMVAKASNGSKVKMMGSDRWAGMSNDISDDQQDIVRGRGMTDPLFQVPRRTPSWPLRMNLHISLRLRQCSEARTQEAPSRFPH